MRKAAGPDPDPTTKRDAVGSECGHGVSDEPRPVPADGTFGRPPPDHSANDFSLHDAWLVERARHGDHQAFALLVRRYRAQAAPGPDAADSRPGTRTRPGARNLLASVHPSQSIRHLAAVSAPGSFAWRLTSGWTGFATANMSRRFPPRSIEPVATARRRSRCLMPIPEPRRNWHKKFSSSWD